MAAVAAAAAVRPLTAVTAVAVDPHLYDTLVAADADGCIWQVQLQARGDPVVSVVAHVIADKVGVAQRLFFKGTVGLCEFWEVERFGH